MRALVTGDQGFIGRHMVAELKRRGWWVDGYDLLQEGDVVPYFMDPDSTEFYDLVVHCAYRVGGRVTIDGLNLALAENLQLDAALFNWALKARPGAIIYYSSSAAYPVALQKQFINPLGEQNLKLREDDIDLDYVIPPDAHYGWAKLTGEKLAARYAEMGGRVHVFRPFSGYGQDQGSEYPFPAIVKRVLSGDYTVWGPKGQSRDWIHIDDIVEASLAAYQEDFRLPVNLCTGVATEFGELVCLVARRPVEVVYEPDKPTGVYYRVGDPSLLHSFYTPRISIDEGVHRALSGR